jgi:hypothetical protein
VDDLPAHDLVGHAYVPGKMIGVVNVLPADRRSARLLGCGGWLSP